MENHLAKVLEIPNLTFFNREINKNILKNLTKLNSLSRLAKPLVNQNSKNLRSTLMLAVALKYKVSKKDIIQTSTSIELTHLASLIHDDIIDHATLRRNKPTLNAKYHQNIALLNGDSLFTLGYQIAYQQSLKIGQALTEVFQEICFGQYLEFKDLNNPTRTTSNYLKSIQGKTAQFFSTSLYIGGLLANLDQKKLNQLKKFGLEFGLAFQIIDDYLDYFSTIEQLHKPILQDLKEGNFTYPYLKLKEKSSHRISLTTNNLIKEMLRLNILKDIKDDLLKYQNKAKKHLSAYSEFNYLNSFFCFYLNYCLQNLTNLKYLDLLKNK